MPTLELPLPVPFRLRDVALSHGWVYLPPYRWDEGEQCLIRREARAGERVEIAMRQVGSHLVVAHDASSDASPDGWVAGLVRHVLALEQDLAGFHELAEKEQGLIEAARHGQGRILRCPTIWEDVVKTLFSVNTTWRQTVNMTRCLVELCGPEGVFPTPERCASLSEEELRERCRVGYRAASLLAIARGLSERSIDLGPVEDPELSDADVEARLRALPGIGPYAAANVMMLLGRWDHLPVDSWFRQTVRDAWFGGAEVSDRELVAAFDRFRPYRTLVYRFYDWRGTDRREDWRPSGPAPEGGGTAS